jgi:hypothetical protein
MVLECPECFRDDTAFEPREMPESEGATTSKAVSRFACHRTPRRKREVVSFTFISSIKLFSTPHSDDRRGQQFLYQRYIRRQNLVP